EYSLAPGLPPIQIDASRLRQVMMNLLANAAEAIGRQKGRIEIRAHALTADRGVLDGTFSRPDLPSGDYVQVQVSDTGSGMSLETQTKIFDPFFTTKKSGTGLGLAVVHGIVRGGGGAIQVQSAAGQGTTFQILLPAAGNTSGEKVQHLKAVAS
ncbi:MAG: ATP-binding protein, partial [Bdellovibrionota bacterium]